MSNTSPELPPQNVDIFEPNPDQVRKYAEAARREHEELGNAFYENLAKERILRGQADTARDVSEGILRARAGIAEEQTLYDPQTGLYNESGFYDRLVAAAEEQKRHPTLERSVGFVDLDGLKEINNTGGHAEGTRLILRAAEALSAGTRKEDVVAHPHGDEFTVLLNASLEETASWYERIKEMLVAQGIRASIGIALLDPYDIDQSLHHADQAMYKAKEMKESSPCRGFTVQLRQGEQQFKEIKAVKK